MKTVRHMEIYLNDGRGCTLPELRDAMAMLEGQLGSDCFIRFRPSDTQFATVEMSDGPRCNVGIIMGSVEIETDRYGTPTSSKDSEKI